MNQQKKKSRSPGRKDSGMNMIEIGSSSLKNKGVQGGLGGIGGLNKPKMPGFGGEARA